MSRKRILPESTIRARHSARDEIIAAANRYALTSHSPRGIAPYGARHVQRAAGICRRWGLVPPHVLVTAGFNPLRKPRAR